MIIYTNHRVLDHLSFDSYEWIPWDVALDYFKMRNDSNYSVLYEAISYIEYYYLIFNSKPHENVIDFIKSITFEDYKKMKHYIVNDKSLKILSVIREKLDIKLIDFPAILKEDYLKNQSILIYNKLSDLIVKNS